MQNYKNVLVIGATGGSGKHAVNSLIKNGHRVTTLSRSALIDCSDKVISIYGSALDRNILKTAIRGQDAVIITLGISENPFRVRLLGAASTSLNIRSEGTKLAIEVMKELNVRRLLVQTTYGSGPSRCLLKIFDKIFFQLILKPQIDDTELQDRYIRRSNLDWTISQPVHLTDKDVPESKLFKSFNNKVSKWEISRNLAGFFLATSLDDETTFKKTVAISQD